MKLGETESLVVLRWVALSAFLMNGSSGGLRS